MDEINGGTHGVAPEESPRGPSLRRRRSRQALFHSGFENDFNSVISWELFSFQAYRNRAILEACLIRKQDLKTRCFLVVPRLKRYPLLIHCILHQVFSNISHTLCSVILEPLCSLGNAEWPMIAGHYTRNCCPATDTPFASVGPLPPNRLASSSPSPSLSHNDGVAIRNGPCKNYLVGNVWHAVAKWS